MSFTRTMTARMAQALRDHAPRGLFVYLDHPSGAGYFSTGTGLRTWNGQTWTGTGTFGSIRPVKQSSEIAIQDIVFSLSGVDTELAGKLNDNVLGRAGKVWLFCTDPYDQVVADPFQLVESELDFQTLDAGDDLTTTIQITAHAGFHTLDKGLDEAWTPENQRLRFPLDTGMDMIPLIPKQNLQWKPS